MKEYTQALDIVRNGLRKDEHKAKNSMSFIQLDSMLVEDEVLKSLDTPAEIDVSSLNCSYPFPQIFRLSTITLVCTATKVYEYNETVESFTELISVSAGSTWTCADFHEFIMLTNGAVLVAREGDTGDWLEYTPTNLTSALCVCALNGQLIVGGPGTQASVGWYGE